jgi:hypothetical protein
VKCLNLTIHDESGASVLVSQTGQQNSLTLRSEVHVWYLTGKEICVTDSIETSVYYSNVLK